jgi:hypothetical protein
MEDNELRDLESLFAQVEDPRMERTKLHRLRDIIIRNLAMTCFTYTFPIHWTKTLSGQQGDNEAPRGQLCGVWQKTAREWARHATSPTYAGRRHCSSDLDRSQESSMGEGRITEVAGVFKTPPLTQDGLNQSPPAYAPTIHLQLFG